MVTSMLWFGETVTLDWLSESVPLVLPEPLMSSVSHVQPPADEHTATSVEPASSPVTESRLPLMLA